MFVTEKQSRVAFGLFEADFDSGELWKAGRKIRLQTQPFKVLEILIGHSGEVVSREELQSRVWEPGTNVDFDRALAGAINKIRDALGDSAENPRFIETLAKRGYRFIAPVGSVSRAAPPEAMPAAALPGLAEPKTVPTPMTSPTAAPALPPPAEVPVPLSEPARQGSSHVALRATLLGSALVASFLLGGLISLSHDSGRDSPPRLDQITFDSPISPGPPNAENLPSLIPAGNRVITSVLIDGKPQLGSISVPSGDLQQITLPQELVSTAPVDLSRDGTRLLVLSRLSSSSEQPLWVVPVEGGSALRVGDILAHDATWMPDGKGILYASGNELWLVASEGGSATHLATLPGRAFWLRWSPDATLLRFTLIDPLRHTTTLWEMQRPGRAPHPLRGLGTEDRNACCGTWTADGRSYLFQVSRPGSTDLWELDRGLFGSTLLQLTNGPLRFFSPVAARSGRRIYLLGADPPLRLQRFDPAAREFVPGPEFLKNATRVTYSRDAQWVAWTDTEGRLWRARAADGSQKLQLTPSEVDVFSAAWSPGGRRLALMARLPGQPWQIWLISAAGGELRQLTHEKHNAADPTWSADGTTLAFGGEPDLMGKEGGTHSVELLNLSDGKTTVLPGSEGLFSPRWSPDGQWIAALSLDQKQLRLFDFGTRQWRSLQATSAADPVWGSDSKALFVHDFLADGQPILRIEVATGATQRVAELPELNSKGPANYFFSGLDPANRPLVLPRVGTSDLYTLDLTR